MNNSDQELSILIKGAGEMGSAIAHTLYTNGFKHICMTELQRPLSISRSSCYSEVLFKGYKIIDGVKARSVSQSPMIISSTWIDGHIAVLIDPNANIIKELNPDVIIDARHINDYSDTSVNDAKLVIGIGDKFEKNKNCHIVIESSLRRPDSVKQIKTSSGNQTQIIVSDTILIWAGKNGLFNSSVKIGDHVNANDIIGKLDELDITAPDSGTILSILRNNTKVQEKTKLIEISTHDQIPVNGIRPKWSIISNTILEAIKNYQKSL